MRRLVELVVALSIAAGAVEARPPMDKPNACSTRNVSFSGIPPLQYADVSGEAGAKLFLHPHPSGKCSPTESSLCTQGPYLVPGDSVAIGKSCGEWAYVQYLGKVRVTRGGVPTSNLTPRGTPSTSTPEVEPSSDPAPSSQRYAFKLTKGTGVPVCEAYLQRLNQTDFDSPPYCGRPESELVPGFALLHRRWLTLDQYRPLWSDVHDLARNAPLHSGYVRQKNPDGSETLLPPPLKVAANFAPAGWLYDPRIDIDNDGEPDNVVIWSGNDRSDALECGGPNSRNGLPIRGDSEGLILTKDLKLDPVRTLEVFGRFRYLSSHVGWPEIGGEFSVFRFRDLFYFDTFSSPDTDATPHTLLVYVKTNSLRQNVCKYDANLGER
jgi:hypothetical protein